MYQATLTAGQTSQPMQAGTGSVARLTISSGSGYVQYTSGSFADITNNVATWTTWPKGTVSSTTQDTVGSPVIVRFVCVTGTLSVMLADPSDSEYPSNALAPWESMQPTWNIDTSGNILSLNGLGSQVSFNPRQPITDGIDLLAPGNGVTPTASAGAGATVNSSGFVTIDNEQWFKVNCTGTSAANNYFEINIPTFNTVSADTAVIEYQTDTGQGSPLVLYLGTAGYAVFATGQRSMSAATNNDPFQTAGRTVAVIQKDTWTKNSYTRDTIEQQWVIAKLRVTVTNGQTRDFYLRSIRVGTSARKGRLAIVADDGYASFLRAGVPVLDRYGVKSTMAIIADLVGSSSLYATLTELRRYVDAGNTCVAHGPIGGTGNLYTTYTTNAQRIADMNYHRDWLVSNGLTDANGAKCYVWPQGVYSSGSGEVSLLMDSYAAGYRIGRAATAYPSKSGSLPQHLPDVRGTSARNQSRLILPIIGHDYNGATNTPDDANETTNINRIITTIQNCAATGQDAVLMLHKVVGRGAATAGGIEIEVDRLISIASAIQTVAAAQTLETVLLSEMV